jgi:Ca2+-binding RTX toxin-like protein
MSMGLYTGFQFTPGTNVYYTYELPFGLSSYGVYEITNSYRATVRSVFEEWDDELNFNFVFTSSYAKADVIVAFVVGSPGGVLGVAVTVDSNSDGIISGQYGDGAAIFMDYYDTRYFRSVLRHEVGHALGLDHDETPGSLMNSRLFGNETITDYDVAKAAELYGYDATGTSGSDVFRGSSRGDRYFGNSGADTISGMGGNDILYGNNGLDYLYGGSGNDTLFGGQNDGSLTGSPAAQRDGIEYLFGGDGNDILYGNHGSDILLGEGGNDIIYGGQDADGILGGYGNDVLFGNAGADAFFFNTFGEGNEGHDTIYGFSSAQGDSLVLTNASVASSAATAAGLTLTLSTGTQITLIGVHDISEVTLVS